MQMLLEECFLFIYYFFYIAMQSSFSPW